MRARSELLHAAGAALCVALWLCVAVTLVHAQSSPKKLRDTSPAWMSDPRFHYVPTQAPQTQPSEQQQQQQQLNKGVEIEFEKVNFSDLERLWWVKGAHEVAMRVAFVAPILLLGILGNFTIIYSMLRFKPFRLKPTNIFILNMAVADLLTTLVCPLAALFTDIYQFYVLGSFICRFEGFVKITCLLVSSYSLIVLSADWLLCVVQPCRTRINIKQSWAALSAIWSSSVLMAAPLLLWRRLRERQWQDLVEIWCCELIQYTKYYWVVITFFLIYLPTIFMTITLVAILAQMDKFEAKLKRERELAPKGFAAVSNCASSSSLDKVSSHSDLQTEHNSANSSTTTTTSATTTSKSMTINMKYRRRIVRILGTYLLTSIVCWSPLQFTIIYRHFRTNTIPSPWYFELTFWAQLSASLTAAMNPIIFGFLSQPFRRLLGKWLRLKLFDTSKWWTSNARNGAGANIHMVARATPHQHHHHHHNHHHHQQQQQQQYNLHPPTPQLKPQVSPGAQRVASKRVSFDTATPVARKSPKQRRVHSHHHHHHHRAKHNAAFEPGEPAAGERLAATSFTRQRGAINAAAQLSYVSMTSIDFEKNLDGDALSASAETAKELDDSDANKVAL